jgi:hypothetical protein
MAKKRSKADRPAALESRVPSKLDEALAQLEQIKQDTSLINARIHADDVRDALLEFNTAVQREMQHQLGRKRKLKKQRRELRERLLDLLQDLSTGSVILPRPPGRGVVEHEQLLAIYQQLRTQDFPDLARRIHEVAGRGSVPAHQRFLSKEVLIHGSRMLVEHLVRLAATERKKANEEVFLVRLRNHLANKVRSGLARKVGYQMTPEVAHQLDAMLVVVLTFLMDLLTTTPAGRLLVPRDRCAFDPHQHEPVEGQGGESGERVKATLFPGYVVIGTPPRILAKALVITDRRQPR